MKPVSFMLALMLAAAAILPGASPEVAYKEYKLKNGLRIVLSEDHSAPTYSIAVTYNVGSRDEKPGRTGFAHLFEHMMYQGSENVGKGEHFSLIQNNGGDMNGTTSNDRTNYFEMLPANQMDLGLFVEADRMRSLVINQANLDNQRNAVQEERRLRVDNQPYGKTFEAIYNTAFDDFGYKHSTIGSMEDLNAASVEDVQAFFKRYYAPNNAVVAIVGDFKSDEVLKKMEKYFGSIPSQPTPPLPDVAEPEQHGERRTTLEDQFAQIPRVDIAFKVPPANSPDIYALDLLTDVMGSGQSSRFYQALVKDKELAVQAVSFLQAQRGTSVILFIGLARPGKEIGMLEKGMEEEIAHLQTDLISEAELARAKMKAKTTHYARIRSSLSRAMELSQDAVFFDDPGRINSYEQNYQKVSREDVQRVAKKYLVEANRTVVITMPKAAAKAAVK
jgi:zinc protease